MFRQIILFGSALAVVSGVAQAADLPAPPTVGDTPVPFFAWTGPYMGLNAGYASGHGTRFVTTYTRLTGTSSGLTDTTGLRDEGFTAGGQIGYNYQFGAGNGLVAGIEADAAYTDIDRSQRNDYTNNFGSVFANPQGKSSVETFHTRLDFLGTLRGRVGYAFDRILLFGTGGLAYGNVGSSIEGTYPAETYSSNQSRIQAGYAYGGGVEYALADFSALNVIHAAGVTVKAEYLRYDLGNASFNVPNQVGNTNDFFSTRVKTSGSLIRAGLNYQF